MQSNQEKRFLTYEKQIELLKSKKLTIEDENKAIECLKRYGERLFNYTTKKSILDLPVHHKLNNYNPASKNNLFNVMICFKYLSSEEDFITFFEFIEQLINILDVALGDTYLKMVLDEMGFPENWKDLKELAK